MAVKVLNAGTEAAVALREVSFLVRAHRHPNIVKFHGAFRNVSVPCVATRAAPGDDTQPCSGKGSDQDDECRQELSVRSWAVAQEWCRHGDLFQFIVDHGPCDEEFGQEVVRVILSGLEWLHELEIVHRDVKSENIAIDDRGPVLLDFGIAAWLRDEKSMKVRCGPWLCGSRSLVWQSLWLQG
jgi:serine/threonine protein kinase